MELDLTDRAQRRLVLDTDRFDEVFLSEVVSPGDTVWDIGASVGYTALLAAAQGASPVIAFEPDPETLPILERNVERNNGGQIEPKLIAVSSSNGTADFHRGNEESSGIHSLAADERLTETVSVMTRTVDRLAETGDSPDLVKIDVEGAEHKVLEGASAVLANEGPDLLIEIHSPITGVRKDRLAQHGGSPKQVLDLLNEHGYEVEGVTWTGEGLEISGISSLDETPLHWFARK